LTSESGDEVMADTGENRQITGRINAKEAEMVRASKQMLPKKLSAVKGAA